MPKCWSLPTLFYRKKKKTVIEKSSINFQICNNVINISEIVTKLNNNTATCYILLPTVYIYIVYFFFHLTWSEVQQCMVVQLFPPELSAKPLHKCYTLPLSATCWNKTPICFMLSLCPHAVNCCITPCDKGAANYLKYEHFPPDSICTWDPKGWKLTIVHCQDWT